MVRHSWHTWIVSLATLRWGWSAHLFKLFLEYKQRKEPILSITLPSPSPELAIVRAPPRFAGRPWAHAVCLGTWPRVYLCNNTKNYNKNDNHNNNNSYCLLGTKHSANWVAAYKPHLDHYTFNPLIAFSRPNVDVRIWNDKSMFLAWESCLSMHSLVLVTFSILIFIVVFYAIIWILLHFCTYFIKMHGMEKGKHKSAGFNDK